MIRESPVLRCPTCGKVADYIIAKVNGPGAYQPCGCPVRVSSK